MRLLKAIWKRSKLRFWIKNLTWNYSFWLYAKPVYKQVVYKQREQDLDMNDNLNFVNERMKFKTNIKQQNRFAGYMFNNSIYLDNPGPQNIEEETRLIWKKKGWI